MGALVPAVQNTVKSVAGQGSGFMGGMLGGMADAAGITNNFQGVNPIDQNRYNADILQGQQNFQQNQQQQNALAQALLAQSQGQGPNPAQAMLNQATNQNIKQGAGMIASQKGISPALAGRSIADMTGQMNQQAAGQAATMNAEQQLGAQKQLGSLYGQSGGQNLQNQQMMNQALLQGSLGSQGLTGSAAASNAEQRAKMFGGAMGGVGAMAPMMMAASHGAYVGGEAKVAGDSPVNDTVPAMLSPQEIVLPRSVTLRDDAPDAAKAFVEHLLAKKNKSKK